MQNQFCKNCGQANFPNATTCTKCGNSLSQIVNNQFSSSNQPPVKEKKSNKMFWIIGIVAVLLIFFVGLIGIAGIGGYLYFSNQDEVVRDYPKTDKDETPKDETDKGDKGDKGDNSGDDDGSPLSDIKFPATTGDDGMGDSQSGGNAKITNAQLLAFFSQQKATVGSFRLDKVSTIDGTATFPSRIAGVEAKYSSGSKKITHNFAAYDSNTSLKEDFELYRQFAKKSGGKITNSTETSIIYIKGSLVYFAFYNPQGGFHEMSSRVGKDILKYHNDYFGIKE
jgi:hypothetical protein